MIKASTVASYLMDRVEDETGVQLQMLLYYAQGCYLALHGQPLFDEPIEASADGPVVRRVLQRRRGKRTTPAWRRAAAGRTSTDVDFPYETRQILNLVAETLGSLNPDDLAESARQEPPWRTARRGIPDGAPSRRVVKLDDMKPYFERACLAQAIEPGRDELSPAAFKLCMEFAHRRAFTPPVVAAEHAEEWFAKLDAPPRDLPGLRALLTEARKRTRGRPAGKPSGARSAE